MKDGERNYGKDKTTQHSKVIEVSYIINVRLTSDNRGENKSQSRFSLYKVRSKYQRNDVKRTEANAFQT